MPTSQGNDYSTTASTYDYASSHLYSDVTFVC